MPIVTHKDNGSEFEVNEKVGQTGWPSMVLEINAQLGVSGAADRSSHGSGLHSRVWWPSFCFCLRQKNSALTQKEPSQYMSATRASYIFNNLYALLMKNMLRLRFKFKVQSFKSIDESIVQFCEMPALATAILERASQFLFGSAPAALTAWPASLFTSAKLDAAAAACRTATAHLRLLHVTKFQRQSYSSA